MGPTKSDPSDWSKDCFDKLTTRKIAFAYYKLDPDNMLGYLSDILPEM